MGWDAFGLADVRDITDVVDISDPEGIDIAVAAE